MRRVKFTAIVGMAIMMSVPAISLADNGKTLRLLMKVSASAKVLTLMMEVF